MILCYLLKGKQYTYSGHMQITVKDLFNNPLCVVSNKKGIDLLYFCYIVLC